MGQEYYLKRKQNISFAEKKVTLAQSTGFLFDSEATNSWFPEIRLTYVM